MLRTCNSRRQEDTRDAVTDGVCVVCKDDVCPAHHQTRNVTAAAAEIVQYIYVVTPTHAVINN